MKNTSVTRCSICHDAIQTQHVFSENDQVYLKIDSVEIASEKTFEDQWSPINFQWISDFELRKNFINQSNQ
ncbi:hypothetical protein [uncultured Kriegella sp.]|uniref:hypothetical protein n=1 Tax=uncultured Kriegella sp. TaxID=1798910 RepID=UPI0030D8E261